jgi:hypothetical protein
MLFWDRNSCSRAWRASLEPKPACLCLSPEDTRTARLALKTELQQVRAMAEARIRSGNVPDWSWPQHVQLIEAVDAMLHDISVAENAHQDRRYFGGQLRLVSNNRQRQFERRNLGSRR